MDISVLLDSDKKEPLYIQLYEYFKKEIQYGRIPAGEKLPSKRKLADHLSISQNTVNAAYDQLSMEGYITSRPRSGFFASYIEEALIPSSRLPASFTETADSKSPKEVLYDFSHGHVDRESFPFSVWRKLSLESLHFDSSELFLGGHVQGERILREQISNYLYHSRGVRSVPEQIIIGAGTQHLIWLLSIMLGKNQQMAFEDPGYHRARVTFEQNHVSTVPVELDEGGISLDSLKKSQAGHVYVTPSHQFPYGMIMPITRRLELLQWAQKQGGYIIEDDYDGEFRYKGKPVPSLQGLDSQNRVVYLGTFSKSLIPSLRISYMILPKDLMEVYASKCSIYKQTVSRLHQHTLYLFMKNGHWDTHLNRLRTVYRKKQQWLLAAIKQHMGEKAEIIGEHSGLHILLRVRLHESEHDLIRKALYEQVKVYPTSVYRVIKTESYPEVLLGFGGLSKTEIELGIQRLSRAWFDGDVS